MRQPVPTQSSNRAPGRSFDDPSRPLGEDMLNRSAESNTQANEDFRPREAQADMPHNGVAERAKAIAVLRKFEELVATNNPPATDEPHLRRALELAAGRCGLTIEEYEALVKDDSELLELERKVLDVARTRFD